MSHEITTAQDVESLSNEVTCLKILLSCMLKSMGQVDAGKAILRMEKQLKDLEDGQQKELFIASMKQIKSAYLS